jgi:hypothetical protein
MYYTRLMDYFNERISALEGNDSSVSLDETSEKAEHVCAGYIHSLQCCFFSA